MATPIDRVFLLKVFAFIVLVHAVAYFGKGLLTSPLPLGWDAALAAEAPPLARFDAASYRAIAEDGYSWSPATGIGNVAFLPFYPFLMRILALFRLPLFWAGTVISHVSFLTSVVLLRKLEALSPEPVPAHSSLLALLAFPWAFFLLAPYSESLFLALALAVFLQALRERWALVALLGFLAGLTRVFGLALVPPLLMLAWSSGSRSSGDRPPFRLSAVAAAFAPAAGFIAFMAWLALRFGDPFLFFHAQQRGWGRSPGWSGLQASLQAIRENISHRGWLHLGPAVDLVIVLLLLAAAVQALRSRAPEKTLYVGSGLLLILASGSLLSSGRYALVLFPVFGFLALLARRPLAWRAYLFLSSVLQAYLVVRFVNNLWVA